MSLHSFPDFGFAPEDEGSAEGTTSMCASLCPERAAAVGLSGALAFCLWSLPSLAGFLGLLAASTSAGGTAEGT